MMDGNMSVATKSGAKSGGGVGETVKIVIQALILLSASVKIVVRTRSHPICVFLYPTDFTPLTCNIFSQ